MPMICDEQPITERLLCEWIASDPERWMGEPMELRLVGGRGRRPDLVGVDAAGSAVVVEVKQDTVFEVGPKKQHVTQLLGYLRGPVGHLRAWGLQGTGKGTRGILVAQLVDGSARLAASKHGLEWREVIEQVPGRMPSRGGHPKSTRWMRLPSQQAAAMVHLMEEYPGVTRRELAEKLQTLKTAGLVRGNPNLATCMDNVEFWSGRCPEGTRPESWWYIEVTSDGGPDSPMVKERYHLLDPDGDHVTLVWDDGTARKTMLPDEWCSRLAES